VQAEVPKRNLQQEECRRGLYCKKSKKSAGEDPIASRGAEEEPTARRVPKRTLLQEEQGECRRGPYCKQRCRRGTYSQKSAEEDPIATRRVLKESRQPKRIGKRNESAQEEQLETKSAERE